LFSLLNEQQLEHLNCTLNNNNERRLKANTCLRFVSLKTLINTLKQPLRPCMCAWEW